MTRTLNRIAYKAKGSLDRRSSIGSARLMLVTVLLLGAMLAGSSWLARSATGEQREAEAWQEHTFTVLSNLSDIRVAILSIRRGERGYLLTGDENYLQPYTTGMAALEMTLPQMRRLLADNAREAARGVELIALLDEYVAQARMTVAEQRAGNHADAVALVETNHGRQLTNRVMAVLDRMEAVEQQLLDERNQRADNAARRSDDFQDLLNVSGLLLLVIGAYSSLALRNAILREEAIRAELDRVATTDELTGLANRRELFSSLDRMIAASRRSGRPVSVAVLDIDRFKLVNDTHGHPAGDEVIRRISQMAQLMMREQDLVGRLGGEEFLIAFPDCPASDAAAACERLRQGIAALPVLLPSGRALSVTISSGVAELIGEDSRQTIISRADEALYRAKKAGRDQVHLAA